MITDPSLLLDDNLCIDEDDKADNPLWDAFCDWFMPEPPDTNGDDPSAPPHNPPPSPYDNLVSILPTGDITVAQIVVAQLWDAFQEGNELTNV